MTTLKKGLSIDQYSLWVHIKSITIIYIHASPNATWGAVFHQGIAVRPYDTQLHTCRK